MLNPKVAQALNHHVNAEMYSAYLYLAMSAYLESQQFSGMARWMKLQAQEELGHAMKFFDHINQRGGVVKLEAIAEPSSAWDSPLAVFDLVYRHECEVTRLIHQLMDLALAEKDYAASIFLQGFVTEQVEEEAHASEILGRLKMVEGSRQGLLMLDHHLGQRQG